MKNIFFLILIGVFAIGYFYFSDFRDSNLGNNIIESPLPNFLTKTFPKVLGTGTVWRPNESIVFAVAKKPDISAKSAISYDLSNNQLLFGKDIKEKLPIASLTKIMTAVVALENSNINQELTVTSEAANVGEDSMGLSVGEKLTLEELVYGLILHSANDAAETIAQGSRFGRDNFVYLMNKKAEDLGLSDTRFTNPTGLEGDGNQYSTVYDLLVITKYALQNPEFEKIVSSVQHEIPQTENHKDFYLFNETNLLTSYPGVAGVKTGYTFEAGLCLVTYLDYQGHKIIAVILNAQNRRQEMKDILDYSLKIQGIKPPAHS